MRTRVSQEKDIGTAQCRIDHRATSDNDNDANNKQEQMHLIYLS